MKIFNSQGKLFNVINIIDLIFILVFIAIIVGVVSRVTGNSFSDSSDAYESEAVVILKYITPDEEELNILKKGDQLVARDRLQQIFIEDIIVKPERVAVLHEDKLVETVHPFSKEVYITIRGEAYIDDIAIYVANQNVRVGNDFFLKTLNAEFESKILYVGIDSVTKPMKK
ncbi:MAG TPA: DUF4330 domain-containing protein [Clostridia bacterium]|nr:DUF4330 domain-containing protein [Clostridia bacterium]